MGAGEGWRVGPGYSHVCPRRSLGVGVEVPEELAVAAAPLHVREQVVQPCSALRLLRSSRRHDRLLGRRHARGVGVVECLLHAHHHHQLRLLLLHVQVKGFLNPLQRDAAIVAIVAVAVVVVVVVVVVARSRV